MNWNKTSSFVLLQQKDVSVDVPSDYNIESKKITLGFYLFPIMWYPNHICGNMEKYRHTQNI